MEIIQWSLPQRRDHISLLRNSGVALYEHQLDFQGEMRKFPVFKVDIGFPCYRLANGRTKDAQLERLVTDGLPAEYFTADPDSEPALKKQDEILREMVAEAGLLRVFKKVKQDQPLILDNDGYVINGNRRLCAMRLLLTQDEQAYEHFKHIQVIVLPPCTDRDIKELEGRLQIQPDIRADYSWTAEAMLYRDLRAAGWSDDQIADLYQMRVGDIRELIAMLEDAENYLDTRGSKAKYSHVTKKEYAFRQLQKNRRKCDDDEPRKQLFTSTSYLMLDDPDSGAERLYESIPDAFKFLDQIVGNYRQEFGEQIVAHHQIDDGLDILGGSSNEQHAAILEVLSIPENAPKARDIIRDTLEENRRQEREKKDATYCYRQIQQANTRLQSALSSLDADADIVDIEPALKNIEEAVSKIRDWMSNDNNQS